MNKNIYLDHAAATPLDHRVFNSMQPYFSEIYANPHSLHTLGRKAQEEIEKARNIIAKILQAHSDEIIFTSGGTESINLALKGVAFCKKKGHIITSNIEHSAVLQTCQYLQSKGFAVTYIEADKFGLISAQKVEKAIRKDTILITMMYANNEIGTIQPLREIGRIAQRNNIPFHVDACQAGFLDLNVERLSVDLLTLNGSKIYGPKGIGLLYKRSSLNIEPLLHGGNQEKGLRSGTENISGIIGLAKALELAQKEKNKEEKRLSLLRDYFIAEVLKKIPEAKLNGHPQKRLANNINLSFKKIDGENLLYYLDQEGIFVSTGSACSSQKREQSHVLRAIGVAEDEGTIRFTFGKSTTKRDLQLVAGKLSKIVSILRKV